LRDVSGVRTDFSIHRVLLIGIKSHRIQLLRSVLGIIGIGQVVQVESSRRAIEMLRMEHFSAVFCDREVSGLDGMSFPVAARRAQNLLNPMIPIFVLAEWARRGDVERARDAGVSDVITVPISPRTVASKFLAATQRPRNFIVAPEFFGPDRRADGRAPFLGRDRRTRTARKARVDLVQI
jgi:CheY-like chemotaxis protein